jgi:antitoxin ParD1/3/4
MNAIAVIASGSPALANFGNTLMPWAEEEWAMATMNISLPDEMKAFVENEATRKGFSTVSEYVRAIIREAQERHAEQERLDALLLEGLNSGPGTPLAKADWEHIRREGTKLLAERKQRRK